jgi:uncharacterized protein (UPF0262 family)
VTWASVKYELPVGCIERDSIYSFSVDIRIHSTSKETFRLELAVAFDDEQTIWEWIHICSEQDFGDGWVNCKSNYQIPRYSSTPSKIEFYLVQMYASDVHYDGYYLDDADFDNLSVSFVAGPVNSLVLPDPNGGLASCWGADSQILITSNNLDFDNVATPTIKRITPNGDSTVTVELDETITMTSHEDSEGVYAVEVALLSRNIAFSSDSDELTGGGHLIIYHTNRPQHIDGVAVQKFGQQGRLGRYVSFRALHTRLLKNHTSSFVSPTLSICVLYEFNCYHSPFTFTCAILQLVPKFPGT